MQTEMMRTWQEEASQLGEQSTRVAHFLDEIELTDAELAFVSGGQGPSPATALIIIDKLISTESALLDRFNF